MDLISRQAAIDALDNIKIPRNASWYPYYQQALTAVSKLPSAQPEQKTGEWIYGEHDVAMCDGYRCNKCGFFVPWDYRHKSIDYIKDYHFCPNCGTKMENYGGEPGC